MGTGRLFLVSGVKCILPAPSLAVPYAFGLGSRVWVLLIWETMLQGADSTLGTLCVLPELASQCCHPSGPCLSGAGLCSSDQSPGTYAYSPATSVKGRLWALHCYCLLGCPRPLQVTGWGEGGYWVSKWLCRGDALTTQGEPPDFHTLVFALPWVSFYSNLILACVCVLVAQSCPTLWGTAAHQAPLSMGFSRQEYWSG